MNFETTSGSTFWKGNHPVAKTQVTKKTWTYIRASTGIQTRDHSVQNPPVISSSHFAD